MNPNLDATDIKKFEAFINACKKSPELLWMPELKFFR